MTDSQLLCKLNQEPWLYHLITEVAKTVTCSHTLGGMPACRGRGLGKAGGGSTDAQVQLL